MDNPEILKKPESESSEKTTETGSSKRPRNSGGRVPTGQDFWSKVDAYFAGLVKTNGTNLVSAAWKTQVAFSTIISPSC